jgi:gliding motility-associated-like protein
MFRKSNIWFFILPCLTELCCCSGDLLAFGQTRNYPSQITGVITLNIVTSAASCDNHNGTVTINATGGTAPLMYSINNGDIFQAGNIFSGLNSGEYYIQVRDANGLTVSDSVHLSALPTPIASLGNDTVLCTGSTLFLSVPQQPGYTYLWSDGSTGFSYNVTKAGVYSLKVTNQFGCYVSTSINVLFKATAIFSLGNDTTLCNGQVLQLQPSPMLPGSYLWSNGSTKQSLNIHTPGVYRLNISDSGCVKRDSIHVSYKPNPQISMGSDTALCSGQTLLLDVTNNGSVYSWQDGSTSPTFMVSSAGTYSVKVSNSGCDTIVQILVSYITKPLLDRIKDTTICFNQQLILNAEYPFSTYLWQDGSVQPQLTVIKAGTYVVLVTDQCGTTKDSATVSFENCACQFFIPNAFTPNGDGRNDVFLPKYQCLLGNYKLMVYNRLGQLVFVSGNAALGWDGSYGNQPQPTDTYVWELDYTDNFTGKNMRKSGTVVLIR